MIKRESLFPLIFFFFLHSLIFPQNFSIVKVEPPFWWSGMNHNKIELMIYGDNLNSVKYFSSDEKIKLGKAETSKNGKYLFLPISLSENIPAGKYKIILANGNLKREFYYTIYKRSNQSGKHSGFDENDIIYLITPDRFANGNTQNDGAIGGMPNQLDRSNELARHGGDIAGIISHLDYLKNLGITAVWINPLLENNMEISYHGYAATNLYKIDPRFGTNKLYRKLVTEAHKRNLKIIYDHVSNHVGINHPWIKFPPDDDWFHGTPNKHLFAMHDKMAPFDIHSDSLTIRHLLEGWFVDSMPDLNQKNKHLRKYLIQNLIWWIEYAGIDGVREDTYAYVNQKFMADLIKEVKSEYPFFSFVGEVWTGEPEFLAPYLKNNKFGNKGSELNIITDFAFRDALADFLTNGDIYSLYNLFCKDFIYDAGNKHLIFLDNHDTLRPLFLANGNVEKLKTAFTILFTSRGIPQILYGDEIGMKGGKSDGKIRSDFPGGWVNDEHNAFLYSGRTKTENEIYEYVKKIISLRKKYEALRTGKLKHFPPFNRFYFYIRENSSSKILVIINSSEDSRKLDLSSIKKNFNIDFIAIDLLDNENKIDFDVEIPAYGAKILRLK